MPSWCRAPGAGCLVSPPLLPGQAQAVGAQPTPTVPDSISLAHFPGPRPRKRPRWAAPSPALHPRAQLPPPRLEKERRPGHRVQLSEGSRRARRAQYFSEALPQMAGSAAAPALWGRAGGGGRPADLPTAGVGRTVSLSCPPSVRPEGNPSAPAALLYRQQRHPALGPPRSPPQARAGGKHTLQESGRGSGGRGAGRTPRLSRRRTARFPRCWVVSAQTFSGETSREPASPLGTLTR